jgi:pimeloyl-ACP methyl ester carboxylesterase
MNQTNSDSLQGELAHLRRGVDLQVCYHPGTSPGLVFLHGGLGNRLNWRSQYEFFLHQGREVFTYDLAGHGQSSPYNRYSLGRHRRDLRRLLQRYQIESPVVCCHSYGVPLGLEWVRRNRASGLILIAGGTHNLAPWWEIPLIKFLAWGGRYLYRLPGVQSLTNRVSSEHKHEKIEQFFAESTLPIEPHPYEALEIFWGYNFWQRNQAGLNKPIPVLVITGGQDPSFTREMGDELANSFQLGQHFGQHFHLPDAGHLLIAEYPEMVNTAIADFIYHLNS